MSRAARAALILELILEPSPLHESPDSSPNLSAFHFFTH
jgi:hypothetical protein